MNSMKLLRQSALLLALLLMPVALSAQTAERTYSRFYYQRATLFASLPTSSEDILFVGNSITNGGEWAELLGNPNVKNRGISGDTAYGVLDRLDPLLAGRPSKIFLMIGINDILRGVEVPEIAKRVRLVLSKIQSECPTTEVYVQSVLPITIADDLFIKEEEKKGFVVELNVLLEEMTKEYEMTYIDLYSAFVNKETGMMNMQYSNDGLHLLGSGYQLWASLVKPYL